MDWGNVPDWVAAGIAFLALLIASAAAWATIRTNQAQHKMLLLQQEQISEIRREKRAQQAQRIAFWEQGDGVIHIENFSDLPVHNVVVELKESNDATWTTFPVVEVIRPRNSGAKAGVAKQNVWPELQFATRLRVCFTDASRTQWAVEANGELTELDRRVAHLAAFFIDGERLATRLSNDSPDGSSGLKAP